MTTQIQSTTDYDKFKIIEGNRNIYAKHLMDLTISIVRKNMLAENPIIVNEKMEVIDGQHRLEVARNNNLPVYYVVSKGAGLNEVTALNSNLKKWTNVDFLASYALTGNENYIWMKTFIEDNDISLSVGMVLVYGSDRPDSYKLFARGKFTINQTQKDIAVKRADLMNELRPFVIVTGPSFPRAFVRALIELDKAGEGRAETLVNKVKKTGMAIRPATTLKKAIDQLEGILGK